MVIDLVFLFEVFKEVRKDEFISSSSSDNNINRNIIWWNNGRKGKSISSFLISVIFYDD